MEHHFRLAYHHNDHRPLVIHQSKTQSWIAYIIGTGFGSVSQVRVKSSLCQSCMTVDLNLTITRYWYRYYLEAYVKRHT
eukprot:scaffold225587_cov41-Attheya_sp.AAC.4